MRAKYWIITFVFFIFLSCRTTEINQMKYEKGKIDFFFDVGGDKVEGFMESLISQYSLVAKINNEILSGEFSLLSNKKIYSFIYKNNFIKGISTFDSKKQSDVLNFKIIDKKLTGDILYSKNHADFILLFDNLKVIGNWQYDPGKSIIKLNINFNNKELNVSILEKYNSSNYTFNDIKLEEYEMIIFLLLEIIRIQK